MKKMIVALMCICCTSMAMAQHHHDSRRGDRHERPQVEYGHGNGRHQGHQDYQVIYAASPEQVAYMMDFIKGESFDDRKLEAAKLCVTLCPVMVGDLARIASLFSFDDRKLEFLKYAYQYCPDREYYYTLRDAFSFSSNYDKLMDYIGR